MMDAHRAWLVHDMLRSERHATRLEARRGDQVARWTREHGETVESGALRPAPRLLHLLPSQRRQAAPAGDGLA
jgi:hypothetical protein